MAITVLPPAALTASERTDINSLILVITTLSSVLDNEARIVPSTDRTMTDTTIASINNTITDTSDRLDAIVNPPAPLP